MEEKKWVDVNWRDMRECRVDEAVVMDRGMWTAKIKIAVLACVGSKRRW